MHCSRFQNAVCTLHRQQDQEVKHCVPISWFSTPAAVASEVLTSSFTGDLQVISRWSVTLILSLCGGFKSASGRKSWAVVSSSLWKLLSRPSFSLKLDFTPFARAERTRNRIYALPRMHCCKLVWGQSKRLSRGWTQLDMTKRDLLMEMEIL